jgi:hypothetical protein
MPIWEADVKLLTRSGAVWDPRLLQKVADDMAVPWARAQVSSAAHVLQRAEYDYERAVEHLYIVERLDACQQEALEAARAQTVSPAFDARKSLS